MSSTSSASRKTCWPPNLLLRNGRFYASVRIPESLRGAVTIGRGTHIRRSLRTAHEPEALRRLPVAVAKIRADIEAARRDPDGARKGKNSSERNVADDAAWWREHLRAQGIAPKNAFQDEVFSIHADELAGEIIGEDEDEYGQRVAVYDTDRLARAREFVNLVTGSRVPVATELERFISTYRSRRTGQPLTTRYADRIRRTVKALGEWLAQRGGDHIGAVSRHEAGFFADHLGETLKSAQTVSSRITALSSFWAWMVRRGAATDNPWKGQAPEHSSSPTDADKRPYTDDEVRRLLSGDTYSTLHDMMRIAALSGMRINEIGRLTVADCAAGVFDIRAAKSKAGVRRVPIHSALAPLIARRTVGKAPDAFLIEELAPRKDHTGDRAAKAGNRFTTYRQRLGLDERKPGQTQSNIDFHSFRRWFVTKAEEADQAPHIISAVVGHAEGRQGMTLSRYSGGPSEAQCRAVVESVLLPKGAPADKQEGPRMGDGRWPARLA